MPRNVLQDHQNNLDINVVNQCKELTRLKFNQLNQSEQKKIRTNDIAKYSHVIYELCLDLFKDHERNAFVPQNILELAIIIDSCFSPKALFQENFGFELILLFEALKEKATSYFFTYNNFNNIEQISALPLPNLFNNNINPNRERLKNIIITHAFNKIFNETNYVEEYKKTKNKVTTDERYLDLVLNPHLLEQKVLAKFNKKTTRDLALQSQVILHDSAKKSLKNLIQRYFSNIIAINAFMKLNLVIFKGYTRNHELNPNLILNLYSEPIVLYTIATFLYSDVFSNFITKTLWPEKTFFLSVTLISIVGAAIGEPWVDKQDELWQKAILAISIFAIVTVFHAFKILTPHHKRIYKSFRWFLDYFLYEIGGPKNPGKIFMSVGYVIILLAINNLIDQTGYTISDSTWGFIISWAIVALTCIAFQGQYFTQKLKRYARDTEDLMALVKTRFLQLYSLYEGYTLRSRQAENIWTTSSVILMMQISKDLIKIYPDRFWLPIPLILLVFGFGPRLASLYQYHFSLRLSLQKSISRSYLNYLGPLGNILGLENNALNKINELSNRGSKYPQSLSERYQQNYMTAQTGRPNMMEGERDLKFSILSISLTAISMHYLWDRWLKTYCNNYYLFEEGTWLYLLFHALCYISMHIIYRFVFHFVSNYSQFENLNLEAPGLLTRAGRTIKALCGFGEKTVLQAMTDNVFVIPPSEARKDFNQHAKDLKRTGQIAQTEQETIQDIEAQIYHQVAPPPPNRHQIDDESFIPPPPSIIPVHP